jgi:hypothetical protein
MHVMLTNNLLCEMPTKLCILSGLSDALCPRFGSLSGPQGRPCSPEPLAHSAHSDKPVRDAITFTSSTFLICYCTPYIGIIPIGIDVREGTRSDDVRVEMTECFNIRPNKMGCKPMYA